MSNTQQQIAKTNSYSVKELTDMESVKKKFDDVLGKRAPQFITSLINIVNSDRNLQKATSSSVVASALVAASLNLPINPSLGYMYIIPYGHTATPQIGYKGYIQLAVECYSLVFLLVSFPVSFFLLSHFFIVIAVMGIVARIQIMLFCYT